MGRPRHAKNIETIIDHDPSACPKCRSTEREPYFGAPLEQEFSGTRPNGQAYTHIVRRRTRCKNCGQARIDRTYENRLQLAEK